MSNLCKNFLSQRPFSKYDFLSHVFQVQTGLGFSQLPHLKKHLKSIHGLDKPYMCENCKEFFKTKYDIQQHSFECVKEETVGSVEELIERTVRYLNFFFTDSLVKVTIIIFRSDPQQSSKCRTTNASRSHATFDRHLAQENFN